MNTAFTSFLSLAYLGFSKWSALAGWYCVVSLACEVNKSFSFTGIKVYGREQARAAISPLLFSYSYLPDQRMHILRIIGKLAYRLLQPAAGCRSKA